MGRSAQGCWCCSASKSSFQLHGSVLPSLPGQGVGQDEQLRRPKVRRNPKKAVADKQSNTGHSPAVQLGLYPAKFSPISEIWHRITKHSQQMAVQGGVHTISLTHLPLSSPGRSPAVYLQFRGRSPLLTGQLWQRLLL